MRSGIQREGLGLNLKVAPSESTHGAIKIRFRRFLEILEEADGPGLQMPLEETLLEAGLGIEALRGEPRHHFEQDRRVILGLGSQIKAHIEKRFSMEWSKPAARPVRILWT